MMGPGPPHAQAGFWSLSWALTGPLPVTVTTSHLSLFLISPSPSYPSSGFPTVGSVAAFSWALTSTSNSLVFFVSFLLLHNNFLPLHKEPVKKII